MVSVAKWLRHRFAKPASWVRVPSETLKVILWGCVVADFQLEIKCEVGGKPRAFYTAVTDKAKDYAGANRLHEVPHGHVNVVNRILVDNGFVVTLDGTPVKFE